MTDINIIRLSIDVIRIFGIIPESPIVRSAENDRKETKSLIAMLLLLIMTFTAK
jgi:hypothetical protein